jgi:hypothetical protein
MTLRAFRWIVAMPLVGGATYFLIRFAAQVWLDGGIIISGNQIFSWRALFHLGAAVGLLSATAATFLLLRSPWNWRQGTCGALLLLGALIVVVLPFVGHFVQVDPCLNLGWSQDGSDSCSTDASPNKLQDSTRER